MGIQDFIRKKSEASAEKSEDSAWTTRMEAREKAGKRVSIRKGSPITAPPPAAKPAATPPTGRQPTGSLGEDIEDQIRDIQGKRQISQRRGSRSTGRG